VHPRPRKKKDKVPTPLRRAKQAQPSLPQLTRKILGILNNAGEIY
jgi:hypothetical protein